MQEERKTLVSVLMPVYNGFPGIKLSLNSLLLQTYTDWECIIVNDGSTDRTKSFLEDIKDTRFKVVHLNENKGRGYARQVALEHVSGEYIAYLDADDWYDPNKLAIQVTYLNEHSDIDLIATGIFSYGTKTSLQRVREQKNNRVLIYALGNVVPFSCATAMIRSRTAVGISYNLNINYGEDVDFFARYLDRKKYSILSNVLYYYSEFDSMSIEKMRKAYFEIFTRDRRISSFLKYMYYLLLAPMLGLEFTIKRRGRKAVNEEKKRFQELYSRLFKSKMI